MRRRAGCWFHTKGEGVIHEAHGERHGMEEAFERRVDARLVVSMIACGLMSFAGVVVETAMNVTFPSLMSEFSIDTATVQWVTTGYLLVLTAIMPISSYLKRRFRTKALFIAAITFFMVGTLLSAAAPAFAFLLLGRLMQGVGTGIALPLMFNIIIEQAPLDKMGLMMGIATLITAIAPAVGPSVGGLIVTYWGWRMIFVVLLPLLVLSAAGGIAAIRQVGESQEAHFSVLQFLLVAAGFACLVFAANSAASAGWLSLQVMGLFAAGLALLVLFGVVSGRSADPLVRVAVFKRIPFTLSIAYVVLFGMIVLGLGYLMPYYAQVVHGSTALVAGCIMLPGCIVGAIISPLGGRVLDVFGARKPIMFGAVCQLVAMILFFLFALNNDVWVMALLYVLIPIGQGLSISNSLTNGLRYVPDDLKADGNAAFNTLQQLGGAMGTAVVTSIMGSAQAAVSENLVQGTVLGAQNGLLAMLVISALALACTLAVFYFAKKQGRA